MKQPHGMEVSHSPGDFVLDGDPAHPPQKETEPPIFGCLLWPNGCMDKDATWYEGMGIGLRDIVLDGDPASPPLKGHSPQFSANVRCGQAAGWTKMPLGMEVGLWGPSYPQKKGTPTPIQFLGRLL